MANPIDLRRIRHLHAAVVEGSLTGAAAQLGLTQPALSASIKSLEADLGVSLLERHRRGVTPTAYAEMLMAHARCIEHELEGAWSQLARIKGTQVIGLRVGCGPSESARLLPAALGRLRAVQPGLAVFVEYGLNETLMPMVRRGDIACALSSIPRTATHPDLQHEPLHVDTAVVVARVGHPLAARRSLTQKDLATWPWVLARKWELERKALDDWFAQAGLKPVEPQVETTSAELMKTLVAQTDFLTFVPHEMIHWEERADVLRPLKGLRSPWERHVGVTTRRDEPLGDAARLFIDALRATVRGLARR